MMVGLLVVLEQERELVGRRIGSPDDFLSVVHYCWPIEPGAEGSAHYGPRCRVVSTGSFVDLFQGLLAFSSGDAFRQHTRGCVALVQFGIDHYI